MAISPLSVQQIVSVIRQQMVDTVRLDRTEAKATGSVKKNDGKRGRTTKSKKNGLGDLIGQRVGALQDNDPDRGRKAFRIFLESVLLNELGEDLINDPSFYQLVDDIHVQMESIPEIALAMQAAVAQLFAASLATNQKQR